MKDFGQFLALSRYQSCRTDNSSKVLVNTGLHVSAPNALSVKRSRDMRHFTTQQMPVQAKVHWER